MESNTFSISAYIAAPQHMVFEYLCDLQNLNEWTLSSRMKQKVDDDTWLGTASGYQRLLYYHIRRGTGEPFRGIEWHCGFDYGNYFKVYPTFLFEPGYIEPGSNEPGVYFHWVSFIDPAKRTPMIGQGIKVVHTSECRSLKGALERRAGREEWVHGRYELKTATLYVDAPVAMAVEYLSDLRNMAEWAHLLRPSDALGERAGIFMDEYGQLAEITLRTHTQPSSHVIEQDTLYAKHGLVQRAPMVLVPCTHAFGNPDARGFILQRITFWKVGEPPRHGKLQLEDYAAELINIKRILEAKSGNAESFARGTSYIPPLA